MGQFRNEAKAGFVKKFKGKKKIKTLIEKKQKGLHLSQVERKKIVKLEAKKQLKERLTESVRNGMGEHAEEISTSSLSESSFGSHQPLNKATKRVSFAEKLEHRKLFDKNDRNVEVTPSTASPGKSILLKLKEKRAAQKAADMKAKALKKAKKEKAEEGVIKGEGEWSGKGNMEVVETQQAESSPIEKKKKIIQVPRDLKAKLKLMPKKERKALLREFKAKKKPHMERATKCKGLWEKIRSGRTPTAEKESAISELCNLVKGHARALIYAHDTVRVIECLVALNRKEINEQLFLELTPEIVRMAKSKYARFFVTKMLKYGLVLETAYNDYANAQQRFDIISEFYGKEFVLFRTDKIRTLEQIIAEEPSKQKMIVKHLEEILMGIVDKVTVKHSLTHKLLLDMITFCDTDQRRNLVDSLKDKLPELVHSADGSRVAMHVIWNANAKERKLMVKNFKGLSVKAALEEYGCRVLMSIFDSVDDTVLVNKYITQELANEIRKVVLDKFGVRVAHYIVHPRDGRVLDQDIIKLVKQGDGNSFSKKPSSERYAELFACLAKPLFTFMAANMEQLLYERVETANLVLDSLEASSSKELFTRYVDAEDRVACYSAIAELAEREFIPCDSEKFHVIEHKTANFVIGRLLKCDASLPEGQRLSTHLAKLDKKQLESWIGCNKGCFVLLRMFENGTDATKQKIFDSVSISRLSEYTTVGAQLLLKALKHGETN